MLSRLVMLVAAPMALALGLTRSAQAVVHAGDVAPNFTKTDLDGTVHTLYQYRGKVVVLFLLGWN